MFHLFLIKSHIHFSKEYILSRDNTRKQEINMSSSFLILFSLLLFLNLEETSSCVRQCGGIDIPFPFGIGKGCYLEKWYEIECVNNSINGKAEPFLSVIHKQIDNITLLSKLSYTSNLSQQLVPYWSPDSQPYGSIDIRNPITSKGCSKNEEQSKSDLNLTGTPFYVGDTNKLLAYGCNNTASLNVKPNMVGCISSCSALYNHTDSEEYFADVDCNERGASSASECAIAFEERCKGIGCCMASMPSGLQQVVGVKIEDSNTTIEGCKVAFLNSGMAYVFNPQELHDLRYSTIMLGWFLQTTNISFVNSLGCQNITEIDFNDPTKDCICDYRPDLGYEYCVCKEGYVGSPYEGCKDIDECESEEFYCSGGRTCVNSLGSYHCVYTKILVIATVIGATFGSLLFIGGIYWLYKFIIKQMKLYKRKKFFKRNGGLLLQQQLTSTQGNIEKTRLFSSEELEKATENFSLNRILGEGGQGTVYKGMLVDGKTVAIKKSKIVDEDKLEEFINEVVILSQINHRNIVKLLGCCLETNVPILVYEFISNGNLFEHLHGEFDDDSMVTWEVRLRMAIDVAGAISYLHSAASSPIYHRDVKSTNIMLDEKFRAKVSDFGTSRSVTVDHTHLTTVVSGTMGYMDPEYFQSGQFTDKSDVYSFGVVLAELITGEKSISFFRSQENRTLATYFTLAMKENKLFDIIDARIRDECKLDQVMSTAKIAKRCLNMKGKKRPTMREVSMQLEKIRSSLGDMRPHDYVSENEEEKEEEVMELNIDVESWKNVVVTAPASSFYVAASSSSYSDAKPLFPNQTR